MKHRFDKAAVKRTEDGRSWLCLRVENGAMARNEVANLQDRLYCANISMHRDRRSTKANAYCWELLTKLAPVVGLKKEELYRTYIPDVGGALRIVSIPDENVRAEYARLWSKQGDGWVVEQVGDDLFCYCGSSTFDTAQMARLIDLIVTDCKENGIETEPPERLQAMIDRWEPKE